MIQSIDEKFGKGTLEKLRTKKLDIKILEEIKKINNPDNEQVGHYTGRCLYCHSNDLWSDMTAYGCTLCDSLYCVGDLPPRIVINQDVEEKKKCEQIIDELFKEL
jgi:hypothetical protein